MAAIKADGKAGPAVRVPGRPPVQPIRGVPPRTDPGTLRRDAPGVFAPALKPVLSLAMTQNFASAPPTVFLYTEEKRGNQWVESVIVGQYADFSGSEKFIVVQDPHTLINFVYRVDHYSNNLDAISITDRTEADFAARKSTNVNGATFKLAPPEEAVKLLRGKTRWIQDKGAILSVLLQGAATRNVGIVRPKIQRDRVTDVPNGVPVEYLRDRHVADASDPAPSGTEDTPADRA
jgi:hypothetical protein